MELTPALFKAAKALTVRPFSLIEMDFEDGPARMTSLPFDIKWDGVTWNGVSVLGSLSPVTEGAESKSYGVNIGLSGIPTSFSDYLATQKIQGRVAKVLLGFVDKQHRIIGEPVPVFVGRMDTLDFTVGSTMAASIACESLFVDWERPRIARFTDADQKLRHPDDRGFEFVSEVANKTLLWGVA